MNKKRNIVMAFGVALIVIIGVFLVQITVPENNDIKIKWERNGGFIGLDEDLIIESDGYVSYTSDKFGNAEIILSESEINNLIIKINLLNEGKYSAIPNAADYFMYKLSIITESNQIIIEWVDNWASTEELPNNLMNIQSLILDIIEKAHQETNNIKNSSELAEDVAQAFLIKAPTFKFDGLLETIVVGETIIREIFPQQYIVTLLFDSRHAGYGDRSDQILAQVITSHLALIIVVNDNVVSAIIDDTWNEITQESIIIPLQQGLIFGNLKIGPLCPVEPCNNPIGDIYSSRELVLQPEIGNPIQIKIGSDGSFQAQIKPGVYTVNITDCEFLGCKNELPLTVKVENDLSVAISINIDTGIR